MKPNPSAMSLRFAMMGTIILTMLVACETEPRRFTSNQGSTSSKTMQGYVESFRDSPEMFPRERDIANREMELRYNWATQQAIQKGKVRVRAIAPPLQLTGDDNVDMSTTHQVLLVADDLPNNVSFTNVYEVRVGPKDVLCTVRPAQASDSMSNADHILIEEQLTRLRLDRATLQSVDSFATNFLPTAQARLEEARVASTANQSNLMVLVQKNIDVLAEANANHIAIDVAIEGTNAWIKASTNSGSNPEQILAAQAKRAALTNDKTEKEKEIQALNLQMAKLKALQAGETSRLNTVESVVATFKSGQKTASAGVKALEVLESFWAGLKTDKDRLSEMATLENRYSMPSAVTVSFRALSLKGFPEITIEVIRRDRKLSNSDAGIQKDKRDDDLGKVLTELDSIQSTLKGFLQAEDRKIDPTSRRQMLSEQAGNLNRALGGLIARIRIRKHDPKFGSRGDSAPSANIPHSEIGIRRPDGKAESTDRKSVV